MANPWDNDPIVKPKAGAQPWDDDPIVSRAEDKPDTKQASEPKQGLSLENISRGIGMSIDKTSQDTLNLLAGGVRGAGSIGNTLISAPKSLPEAIALAGKLYRGEDTGYKARAEAMDDALGEFGAEKDAGAYKVGKIGAEIAGTLGTGGMLANGARYVAPALANTATGAKVINSIASAGFRTGAPAAATLGAKAADLGIRSAGGAINGAASSALVDPGHTGLGAVIGGALPGAGKLIGGAAQYVGGKLVNGLRGSEVTEEVIKLAKRAKELGIDVPADRIANSKPLNALAASLNYVPLSGRAATESTMQKQLNQALSRTFGQDSDNVTMALRKASDELGGEFNRVLQANKVNVDNSFLDALAQAEGRASAELGTDGAKIIKNQIDEIVQKASSTGSIDGQAAYNIKKTLDRIGKRNSPEAFYANDLKRDLMEALNRSMTPEASAAFAATRKQYGNMLSLEKLAQNGTEGDVSIARIANMKNIGNKDMQELADISAQFLKAREGQHGAMQRAFVGLGGAAATMNGVLPGSGLAAGMAAGRAGNGLLNSNMMKNAVMGQRGGVENRLLNMITDPRARQLGYRLAPEFESD